MQMILCIIVSMEPFSGRFRGSYKKPFESWMEKVYEENIENRIMKKISLWDFLKI